MKRFATLCAFLLLFPMSASAKNYILFDGNSLVAGYPANSAATGMSTTFPNGTDFPSQVMKGLGLDWQGYNVAVSFREIGHGPSDNRGSVSDQMEDFDANISPIIQEAHKTGASKVIVVNGGEPGNMLYFSTGGKEAQDMAYDALKVYADKVHKAGALFYDITMPARGIQGGQDQSIESDIAAVNLRIRRQCMQDHICDAVVPLDMDPRMQHAGDAKYYTDETHFNADGYQIWADHVLKALKSK